MGILRRIFALALCLCLLAALTGCQTPGKDNGQAASVRVMTLNVAYYDGVYTDNQHLADLAYPNQVKETDYTFARRADRLLSLLKHYSPDVFFLNEFNFAWWKEVISDEDAILKTLTRYTFVESRSTGVSVNGEGETYRDLYNMLFYDREKFTLLDSGSFVALETKPGWFDHCTWAKLKDNATGQEAVYATIHLSTVPDNKRAVKSLQAATNAAKELAKVADGLPIILGGDFNTTEKSRGYYTYKYMVGQAGFVDCRYAAPETDNSGTARIWGSEMSNNGNRIDYIFVNGADAASYKVASGAFRKDDTYVEEVSTADLKTGEYYDISDHLPVLATVTLTGKQSTVPEEYRNTTADISTPANPTGSFMENGGTAEKVIFHFADALNYVRDPEQHGFEASLVEDETYGTVLKLQVAEHMASGYVSFDYGALMQACGLTGVDTGEYNVMKVTYFANTSYTDANGILRCGFLREGIPSPSETNSFGLKTYGKWTTQTMALSLLPNGVHGTVDALCLFNPNGALAGDVIYIASIEFLK